MINSNRSHNRCKDSTDDENGGVPVPALAAMSINSSAESEYAPLAPGTSNHDLQWTQVSTKSWHTQSIKPSSVTSRSNANHYGDTSATSVTGSSRSFISNVAERSDASGVRSNGWVKKSAIPLGTPGHASYQGGLIVSTY